MKHIRKIIFLIFFYCLICPLKVDAVISEFPRYNLTEAQLTALSNVAQNEQGDPVGAAAEASLMANRFELIGKSFGVGADGLYSYVRNSNWFAYAADAMDSPDEPLDPKVKDAVAKVLIEGKRTLPGYVDEHDCIYCGGSRYDVRVASNNGVSFDVTDRSQYIPHVTYITNFDSAHYWFYSFPTDHSDPFGYTSQQNRNLIGDFHYEFDGSAYTGSYEGYNTGIGGPLGGLLTDPFTTFPSLLTTKDFSCRNIFYYQNEQGDQKKTGIKILLDGLFTLIKIGAPILAIALTIVDYMRTLTNYSSENLSKANKRTIKRMSFAIIILLLPFILDLLFDVFGLYDLSSCDIK